MAYAINTTAINTTAMNHTAINPTTVNTINSTRSSALLDFRPGRMPASFDPFAATDSDGACQPVRVHSAGAYVRRQVLAAAAMALVLYMAWLTLGALGSWFVTTADAVETTLPAPAMTYVVQPGDTLWSVATTIDADKDVREIVAVLADDNGGVALHPGQVLDLRSAYR